MAILVLTVAGVEGLDMAVNAAPLPEPASRFLLYYQALEQTDSGGGAIGLWERVLYSWILAGSQTPPAARTPS